MRFNIKTMFAIVSFAAINLSLSRLNLPIGMLALLPAVAGFLYFVPANSRKRSLIWVMVFWIVGVMGMGIYNIAVNGFLIQGRNYGEKALTRDMVLSVGPWIAYGGCWLGVTIGLLFPNHGDQSESPSIETRE